ncbi:hypothetical protein, partial [Klebsiella pneumoniae]|uniref:hypothetical protein n=1 Tax=Klebsiella pneumoniae TaxID=573 RepID=UPI00272F41EF
ERFCSLAGDHWHRGLAGDAGSGSRPVTEVLWQKGRIYMSLFWQELKKIWRPGIFVGIVLLGLIYYYMFPSFYIEHFSNG